MEGLEGVSSVVILIGYLVAWAVEEVECFGVHDFFWIEVVSFSF